MNKDGVLFLLTNTRNNNILYVFPEFYVEDWRFYQVKAIAFRDVNKDGLKDIIIILNYMTGIGNEGTIPFPICNIYFQKGKTFINLFELDDEINGSNNNGSVSSILKFTSNRIDYINRLLNKEALTEFQNQFFLRNFRIFCNSK